MLDLLVKSTVRRKVVALFAFNPTYEFYARQVAKEISESAHAVGLELRYLAKGGLLKMNKRGGHMLYQWNDSYPYASMLKSIVEKMRAEPSPEVRSIPDIAQRQRIEKNLERVLAGIKEYYDPDKIIIFGSAASGKVGPFSDIDVVIVKKTSLPFFKRMQQLVDLLDYDVDIDFLVYTPEEFEQAAKERPFFQREILKKGKVIYEKAA